MRLELASGVDAGLIVVERHLASTPLRLRMKRGSELRQFFLYDIALDRHEFAGAGGPVRGVALRLHRVELVTNGMRQPDLKRADGCARLALLVGGGFAQQPGADRVKRAGSGEDIAAALSAQRLGANALDPPRHLGGGAAGEGHQQHPLRIGAPDDEMRDPMGERVRLAGAGASVDEQRAAHGGRQAVSKAVLYGAALSFSR